MSEVFDLSNISNDPLPDIGEWEDWEEPREFPPPLDEGIWRGVISQVREVKEYTKEARRYLRAILDFTTRGGPNDGRLAASWVRITNRPRQRGNRASQMIDLLKSAGLEGPAPRSNKEFSLALQRVFDAAKLVTFQTRWRGFCTPCYENQLISLTGAQSGVLARQAASPEQRNQAARFAEKARNQRAFPPGSDTLLCRDCGGEVRAQVNIVRFLK